MKEDKRLKIEAAILAVICIFILFTMHLGADVVVVDDNTTLMELARRVLAEQETRPGWCLVYVIKESKLKTDIIVRTKVKEVK